MANTKINLSQNLKKLAEIVQWFDQGKEVDVEIGLEKVREGALLVKACRERLKSVENEFTEIQKDLDRSLEGI